jgi:hypothetical protein
MSTSMQQSPDDLVMFLASKIWNFQLLTLL